MKRFLIWLAVFSLVVLDLSPTFSLACAQGLEPLHYLRRDSGAGPGARAQGRHNVELVGQVVISPFARCGAVAAQGNYAYVAAADYGLRIISVSDPAHPYEVGFDNTVRAYEVAVAGEYAYVHCNWDGLHLISVSNPVHPTQVGHFYNMGDLNGLAVAGNYAYVAYSYPYGGHSEYGEHGLFVISVFNPASPTLAGFCETPDAGTHIAVASHYAYVATTGGLRIINISNPTHPTAAAFYPMPYGAGAVAVAGDYAYVADRDSGLRIINVSDSAHPWQAGFYHASWYADGVATTTHYAYVASSDHGLRIINVSDPAHPTEAGFYDDLEWGAMDVAVDGNYVYVAAWYDGLVILRFTGADTTPPSISNIRESADPINRDGCPSPNTVTIRADVSDASGLGWVRLYYQQTPGGSYTYKTMSRESGNTYKATIGPFSQAGTERYFVAARDNAGNENQSSTGTVTVNDCPTRIPVILIPGYLASYRSPWGWDWNTPLAYSAYRDLLLAFEEAGYERGKDLFVCFYDWTRSNASSAFAFLEDCINEARTKTGADKVHIITHSNGANVARWWVQTQNPSYVDTLIMIAPPIQGVPAIYPLWSGGDFSYEGPGGLVPLALIYNYLILNGINPWGNPQAIRDFFHDSTPSMQELLPVFDYLQENVHPHDWIPYSEMENTNPLLEDLNRSASRLISNTEKVVIVAGYGTPTIRGFNVRPHRPEDGELWTDGKPEGEAMQSSSGDGRILLDLSARLPGVPASGYILHSMEAEHKEIVADCCPEIFTELDMLDEVEHCPPKAKRALPNDTLTFSLAISHGSSQQTQTTNGKTSNRKESLTGGAQADARLLITDPAGRQLGYSLDGVFVDQMPDGEYYEATAASDFALILDPIPGDYSCKVIGFAATEYEMYSFTQQSVTPLATILGSTERGQVDDYTVTYYAHRTCLPLIVKSYSSGPQPPVTPTPTRTPTKTPTVTPTKGPSVYVFSSGSNRVYEMDPLDGTLPSSLALQFDAYHAALAWDGESLWVADDSGAGGTISRIDPADGSALRSFAAPGTESWLPSLATDGPHLYYLSTSQNTIWTMDGTGTVLDVLTPPVDSPSGLAWDNGTF